MALGCDVERPWVAMLNGLDTVVGEAREPSSRLPTTTKQGDRTTTQEQQQVTTSGLPATRGREGVTMLEAEEAAGEAGLTARSVADASPSGARARGARGKGGRGARRGRTRCGRSEAEPG